MNYTTLYNTMIDIPCPLGPAVPPPTWQPFERPAVTQRGGNGRPALKQQTIIIMMIILIILVIIIVIIMIIIIMIMHTTTTTTTTTTTITTTTTTNTSTNNEARVVRYVIKNEHIK